MTTVTEMDWPAALAGALDCTGYAVLPPLLDAADCRALADLYDRDELFRSTVDMARHRYGEGQYRYFAHPLPDLVAELRGALWPHLLPIAREWAARVGRPYRQTIQYPPHPLPDLVADLRARFWPMLLPIAREWAERLGRPAPWPDRLEDWLATCHEAGQARPTPLMLRYGPGDWNALHRDLYGDLVFPLQVVIGLDEPGVDYTGGEFVVVEQRPRAQSRATATTIPRGAGLVFTTRERPVRSARGWSAAPMRHGVSTVRSGRRHTLGLVFHDAA